MLRASGLQGQPEGGEVPTASAGLLVTELPLSDGLVAALFEGLPNGGDRFFVSLEQIHLFQLGSGIFFEASESVRFREDGMDSYVVWLGFYAHAEFISRGVELPHMIVSQAQRPRPGKGVDLHAELL